MRHIDADELIEFFDSYPDHIEFDVEDIKSIINEQDTADVAEIVRCKDCIYWRDTDHTCKHSFTSPRCANDYCSYGKKRDD